ncbi:hypothetical protein HDU81_004942 [Chytriomyces hyalinus]|nr:hypothetical protein HDU81_004942 [Chytriomyces hyalinus]
MANDRYLNVKCKGHPITEVNVTGISRLGGIKQAIKEAFSLQVGHGLIQLYDNYSTLITDLQDIPDDYYKAIRDGGLALSIQTSPRTTR